MIRLLLILSLAFCSAQNFAQIGLFKTYEDFLNNEVVEYPEYVSVSHAFGNFKVVFRDEKGKKVKHKVDRKAFWGYRRGDGKIMRVNGKNDPYVIITMGKIVVYSSYSTSFKEDKITYDNNQFGPLISLGADGEMIRFTKKNLKKILAKNKKALADLKGVRKNYQALLDFIIEYNKAY